VLKPAWSGLLQRARGPPDSLNILAFTRIVSKFREGKIFMSLRLFPLRRARSGGWSSPILLSMGLLDELIMGIPVVALPLLRDRLGLSYTQVGLLFTVAAIVGMFIEPFINLLSDRRSKKPWILCGLLFLTVAFVLIGTVTSYALLLLVFAMSYPAGEAAIDLSQAVVIDAAPGDSTRIMTRWTLLSSIGDFLSPLIVITFVALHLGWTQLCWFAAVIWLATALLLAPLRFPPPSTDDEINEPSEEISIWASLREAMHDPLLLRWSVLAAIPTMLDEVFLSFVVLYLRDTLHVSETLIALIVTLQMLASLAGLFLLERLLKRYQPSPVRLLTQLSIATLFGVLCLLLIHTLWMVITSLLVISITCTGWYPLAKAEAYARKPDRSGVVRVITGLGDPLEVVLPALVGLVSASFGILAGLSILGLAPVLMLLLLPHRRERKH
jgi:MFS family permease